MCGVTGFFNPTSTINNCQLQDTVNRMVRTLRHRGPEDEGTWVDGMCGVALGHRRLSIIDTSSEGHQPMHSACGRYVISFNGEIYNFKLLRCELEGLGERFRGHSDTEVMLAAISRWGLDAAVEKFNGMFAFALWDRKNRSLHLARDRVGEKPLYYLWNGKTLVFGSELKALREHPDFDGKIDRGVLALYLRYNYVPAPYSIYEGILKLPAASLLTLDATEDNPTLTQYWSATRVAEEGIACPFVGPESEGSEQLEALLQDAVALRMEADVPLGAFLSGGIDSSTIVALMQANSSRPINTFTIGFRENSYNEAPSAKAVANHLGTKHTELYVTPEEAMAIIPALPTLYDEPFADASQIPTCLVAKLARRDVTVVLSGDGGDELFAGYKSYRRSQMIHRGTGWIPTNVRAAAGRGLITLSRSRWVEALRGLRTALPRSLQTNVAARLYRFGHLMRAKDLETFLFVAAANWIDSSSVVLGAFREITRPRRATLRVPVENVVQMMMHLDTICYLPDDILVKVDRAAMGVSLESRIPFLDHRVVEFAWRLPMSMKLQHGIGKRLVRSVLHKYVPKHLVEGSKKGFAVPVEAWLRGPLRPWADDLLDERRLRKQGYFCVELIRRIWADHLSGKHACEVQLWSVLMFQAWLENQSNSHEP